jgi:TRAP-type C4-dicarboxylate transport system permease small subunit
LLIWLTFIGAAVALKRKGHIAVDYFVAHLPDWIRYYFEIGTYVLIVVFSAFLCVQGMAFALLSERTTFPALQVPVSWQYLGLPVGCLFMVIYGSLHLVSAIRHGPSKHVIEEGL